MHFVVSTSIQFVRLIVFLYVNSVVACDARYVNCLPSKNSVSGSGGPGGPVPGGILLTNNILIASAFHAPVATEFLSLSLSPYTKFKLSTFMVHLSE